MGTGRIRLLSGRPMSVNRTSARSTEVPHYPLCGSESFRQMRQLTSNLTLSITCAVTGPGPGRVFNGECRKPTSSVGRQASLQPSNLT